MNAWLTSASSAFFLTSTIPAEGRSSKSLTSWTCPCVRSERGKTAEGDDRPSKPGVHDGVPDSVCARFLVSERVRARVDLRAQTRDASRGASPAQTPPDSAAASRPTSAQHAEPVLRVSSRLNSDSRSSGRSPPAPGLKNAHLSCRTTPPPRSSRSRTLPSTPTPNQASKERALELVCPKTCTRVQPGDCARAVLKEREDERSGARTPGSVEDSRA